MEKEKFNKLPTQKEAANTRADELLGVDKAKEAEATDSPLRSRWEIVEEELKKRDAKEAKEKADQTETGADAEITEKTKTNWLYEGIENTEKGNIPFMISNKLKEYLKENSVSEEEIKKLKPKQAWEKAKEIINKLSKAEAMQAETEAVLAEKTIEQETETGSKIKEQILDEKRKEFACFDLIAEEWIKKNKGIFRKKNKEDFEKSGESGKYIQIKQEYEEVIKNQRIELCEKAFKEVEGLGLSEKEASKKINSKIEEVIQETIVKEANKLYDQKMDLKLEAKGDASKAEKMWKFAGQVTEKYRRMPLWHKLAIAGGLLGGGAVAGTVAGATGAALATGFITGHWVQRALGGAAIAVGLEELIKRFQERKDEKKTIKKFGDDLQEKVKKGDKELNERLFELEGGKKGKKWRRYVLAGAAGGLVGSGLLGKALSGFIPIEEQPQEVVPDKEVVFEKEVEVPEVIEDVPKEVEVPEVIEDVPKEAFIESAQSGDSIWKMAETQLEKHYGEKFTGLDEARKTYVIDAIKDRVAENPSKFGLEDVDKLKVGQEVDFSSIFEDKHGIEQEFERAEVLKQTAIENIEKNNQILRDWVKEHPGEQLTSERVEEILAGKEAVISPEITDSIIISEKEVVVEPFKEIEFVGEKFVPETAATLGFTYDEYNAIKDVSVDKLLKEIISEDEAWEDWRTFPGGETRIDLPHHGVYGSTEFSKHIKLAEFIRSFNPDEETRQMTIRQFLRMIGRKE